MKISLLLSFFAFLAFSVFNMTPKQTIIDRNYPEYLSYWKEVEQFQAQGLIDDALLKIEFIYKLAIKDVNHPQIYKCLLSIEALQFQKDEAGQQGIILRLEKSLKDLKEPSASLLKSVLGQLYFNFNQYGYGRNSNTNIVGEEQDTADINTWSPSKMIAKANDYYLQSIQNTSLDKESTKDYSAILHYQNDSLVRPSLYDLLLFRAIDHFKNSSTQLSDFNVSIPKEIQFANLDVFLNSDVKSHQVFQLFQDVLKRNKTNNNIEASIDANLNRLKYAHSLNVSNLDQTLYLNALMDCFQQHKKNDEAAQVLIEIANYYMSMGVQEMNNSLGDQKTNLIKVDSICNDLIKRYPKSHWVSQAQLLKQNIRTQNLKVSIEDVYLIQKPIKFLLTHRNISKAFFRLYKMPFHSVNDSYEVNQDNLEEQLKKFSLVKEWEESWPGSADFMEHSVELKMDGLKSGQYYLMVNNSNDLTSANILQGGTFQVSNLASIKYQMDNHFDKIIVVNRDKGAPIKGAKVVFFESTNKGYRSSPDYKIFETKTTDAEGMVTIPRREQMSYYVSLKDDLLLTQDWLYNMRYPNEQNAQVQYQFFTDRSIYRPGQNVYFKILATINDKDQLPKIKTAQKFVVQLINPNGQEVSKVNLVTNTFGSAQGSFVLPNSGLNGSFNLVADQYRGSQSIQVEEYKRPNFEIVFDTLKAELKLGQVLHVTGKVQSYNGIPVANAVIKYRINKNLFMPYYPCWSYYMRFPETKEQIDFGQIVADEEGRFEVSFIPKKDDNPNQLKPIHHYTIEVDATDLNGETHSQSKGFDISEQSIFISTNMKPYFLDANLKSIDIKLNNIEKIPVEAELHVKIYALQMPKNHLRSRYWAKPDVMKYSQAEFKSFFPNDIYDKEDQMDQWNEISTVLDQKLSSASVFKIDFLKLLKQGAYKMIIEATGENGAIEKLTEYTIVYDKNSKNSSLKPYVLSQQEILEPNSKALFTALSMDEDYHMLIQYLSRSHNELNWKKITKNTMYEYPIQETDRGGVFLNSVCVFQNRIYEQSQQVKVPWSNKELNIKSISFRDKLLPGQQEEWTFEILDRNNKSNPTEFLASMYDASLDQILPHKWGAYYWPDFYMRSNFVSSSFHALELNYLRFQFSHADERSYLQGYSSLNFFGLPMSDFSPVMMGTTMYMDGVRASGGKQASRSKASEAAPQAEGSTIQSDKLNKGEEQINSPSERDNNSSEVQIRKNLNETVFFYPQLYTKDDGKISFSFTMNEAMTKWKLQMFAHTVDLKYGIKTLDVITRKPIQIKPFYPRFFRQGDQMELSATVSNLSEEAQKGQTQIMILDPNTMADVTSSFVKSNVSRNFDLKTNQTSSYKWTIQIPKDELRPLLVRFIAKGNTHSDGEETIIPVVTNRKLITESLPLPIGSKENKSFVFLPLQKLNTSSSASPHSLTLEFTSHPVWYAIQNLPYIMEYPHECSEQLMSRIYANTIGTYVMHQYPKVASTLKQIQTEGSNKSPLLKNEELKSALIEETPWVLAAQSESEQMKRVSLLMDLNTMAQGLESALSKLESRQDANGSWSWFPGGRYDWYITQHIVLEIAHLQRLGAIQKNKDRFDAMVNRAKPFLESMIKQQYELLAKEVKAGRTTWEDNHLGYMELMFLYCKSYFTDWKSDDTFKAIQNYYLLQLNNYWHSNNIYHEGICALIASRNSKKDLAQLITKSLSQRAIKNPELGMYWKNSWSYNWYELPIETQALMVEVFYEITKNQKEVDALKVWLLKNKQTQHWGTTKATTAAIYALLGFGPNTIEESSPVEVSVGNKKIEVSKVDAGSGYFKKQWNTSEINASLATIQVNNPNKSIAWGAVYYQYFEDLDKVKVYKETPLILDKQLFIKEDSKKGPVLKPIIDQTKIKIGDKVTARIIIKVDRPMDYVHLKVMRASGLEPIVQLSGYQWDGGLGYYRSPRDLATDFFFSYLPKGTHVLEYDLRASFKGDFSDGVSTIQSMYAPEFGSHSKGIRIVIGE